MPEGRTKRPRQIAMTPRFERNKRRLPPKTQLTVDEAVKTISADPLAGEQKTGALRMVRVLKFKVGPQQFLLAYAFHAKRNLVEVLAVGPTNTSAHDESEVGRPAIGARQRRRRRSSRSFPSPAKACSAGRPVSSSGAGEEAAGIGFGYADPVSESAKEVPMSAGSAKQKVLEVIERLPADATLEDAIERLVLLAKAERGLAELDARHGIDHAEAKRRLLRWHRLPEEGTNIPLTEDKKERLRQGEGRIRARGRP